MIELQAPVFLAETDKAGFVRQQVAIAVAEKELPAGCQCDDDEYLIAAHLDGKWVGFALCHETDQGFFWLHVLYVSKAWRRRGAGDALVKGVKALARVHGAGAISLGTGFDNLPMQTLAVRNGLGLDHVVFRGDV